jgi:hypothetical protein
VPEFKDRKPRVKEKVEFLHPGFENPGSQVMAKFVEYHENREAQEQLYYFDEDFHNQ